jgi:hypothetical protein
VWKEGAPAGGEAGYSKHFEGFLLVICSLMFIVSKW